MRAGRPMNAILVGTVSVVVVHLLELLIGVSAWFILDWRAQTSIASKLDVEASWSAIENHISDRFRVGEARTKILEEAAKVGVYRIRPFFLGSQYCETYYFRIGPFQSDRAGPWNLCFDVNGLVTEVERYWYR